MAGGKRPGRGGAGSLLRRSRVFADSFVCEALASARLQLSLRVVEDGAEAVGQGRGGANKLPAAAATGAQGAAHGAQGADQGREHGSHGLGPVFSYFAA